MKDVPRFSNFDGTSVYTIKTVVQQTGIAPATLRAWERRYGFLCPDRSAGGYRLYSQMDIAVLRWLKAQVESGMIISRAVEVLEIRCQGEPRASAEKGRSSVLEEVISLNDETGSLARETPELLLEALLTFEEHRADTILSEAFALHPVETVAENVIAPTLIAVGQRWQGGTASIVQEHYVVAFLRRKLNALLNVYGQPVSGPLAITGSGPDEWHDIGSLMLSIELRRHGWRVLALGQNVPAPHLAMEVAHLRPDVLCLSASLPETVVRLTEVRDAIAALPGPRPRLIVGGRAFNLYPELRERFPLAYLGSTATEVAAILA